MGTPTTPPSTSATLCFHCMLRRRLHRLAAWTPTLHAIMNGMASSGCKTCSRMPPATAENAKPASPDTKAPQKAAALSKRNELTSTMDDVLQHCRIGCGGGGL